MWRRFISGLVGLGLNTMPIFHELFAGGSHLTQVLALLQLAFTVWMMVDAYQRGVETFWYFLIFFFQPIGAWAYFFAVKFRTLRWPAKRLPHSGQRNLSFEQLRYSVERAPTVANRIALAERLMEKGAYPEAIPLLEAVLAIEPDYSVVLHALAECRLATNNPEQAVAPLEKLIHRDPCWAHYRAWRTLLDVHRARRQPAAALATCREFAKRLPTLENKCRLAEHLLDNDRAAEAVELLDDALEEQRFSPWSARWHNRRWARMAHRLLLEAEKRQEIAEAIDDSAQPDATADRPGD
jgi:hypothetical protein